MKKFAFLILIIIGCQTDEPDYPEVITKEEQQVGATSVVLEAEVKDVGPVRPINFGFLWDVQQDVTIAFATTIVSGQTSEPRTYSIKLDNLTSSTKYYYRSFVANEGYTSIYYGQVLSFTTLP